MIVVEPYARPDTIPDAGSTEPTDGLLLLHVPPVVASFNAVVEPIQALKVPVIGCNALTVTVAVA